MTCRELSDFLADYVAGELPPQVLAEFETHTDDCGNCLTFLAQYRLTARAGADAFSDLPADALPEELVVAILAAVEKAEG